MDIQMPENAQNKGDDPHKTYLLEPVTLGEIIDRALALLKDNFKDYFIMTAIIYAPTFVFSIFFFIVFTFGTLMQDSLAFTFIFLIIVIPMALFSVLAWYFLLCSTAKLTAERYNGNQYGFKESFVYVYHNLLKLAWTLFLLFFYVLGLMALGIIVLSLFFAIGSGIMIALGILIGMAVFIAAAYLGLSFTLAPQVVMIEGKSGQEALNRSRMLFHSSWDSITKTASIPFFTQMLTTILAGVPYVGFILWLFVGPVPAISLTVLYYDIRINRESYDLEHRIDVMIAERG
jgi:MFS family permease